MSYLRKFALFFPRLKLDRPNLMTTSDDFQRGCLLTFESASPSDTRFSYPAWPRPNLIKPEELLRLSLESASLLLALLSSMPCLFSTYSNSFDGSLKIRRLPSSLSGVKIDEDASAQLQRNAIAWRVQSVICVGMRNCIAKLTPCLMHSAARLITSWSCRICHRTI